MGADYRKRASGVLIFHSGRAAVVAGNTTRYWTIGGNHDPALVVNSIRLPYDCLLGHLHAYSSVAPGVGDTVDITVMQEGAASVLTCQIVGALQEAEDLVNQVAFARGDVLEIRSIKSAAAAASYLTASVEVRRI